MHIVIAPDSFKESLSALEIANIVEQGFQSVFPEATFSKIPVADGGEGTLQAIVDAKDGRLVAVEVNDPLQRKVTAHYGLIDNDSVAIIEMATASGLTLLSTHERNPLITTTYGTGELIRHALDHGAKKIILAIGGSATNDGGTGMLQALGAQFLDHNQQPLSAGGAALQQLHTIDLSNFDARIQECEFEIACDVDNPLVGERGASAIFGPQKGATEENVQTLDSALDHYADIATTLFNEDHRFARGAGAAGGMGFAALAFLKGQLKPGIRIVIDIVNLADAVKNADLVITGEGKIDRQTIFGKTPIGVAKTAKKFGKPVIGIAGSLGHDAHYVHDHGIDTVFTVTQRPETLEKALKDTADNLLSLSRNIAILYQLGMKTRG
ncbi:glycerate kinase [Wohlfahrtiimonas larvae]|uniref:Glycerate kinase n=1 Tax=Wohlfahrtiimonas larvae TaxID=1157986 RepID=A0ABP9MTE8_9GAMM|nr:glycerate kinase [Wohlfahrtiimonas larvae]